MANIIMLTCAGLLAAGMACCGTVSAGPIDNANEFVAKAVSEAEQGSNAPSDQSPDTPMISWEDEGSGTGAAVNADTAGSADSQ